MNKFIAWFGESNRYKHLFGGMAVAALGGTAWAALVVAVVAASCLEFKDKAHGCVWDWTDWLLTVAGGAVSACGYMAMEQLFK